MNLRERINQDFLSAYKEKNMAKKTFLGVIKGEIDNLQGKGIEINDDSIMGILKAMEKSLKLTNNEQSLMELEYLKVYLPTMLSEDEIRKIIVELKEKEVTSIKDVMGYFNSNYRGLVDNSIVAKIIKEG